MYELSTVGVGLTATCLVGLLAAEAGDSHPGRWLFKPLASLGFLLLAWGQGAGSSTHGRVVLVALVLCLLGDVLLIHARGFLAGLVAFLLGHVAWCVAFALKGMDWTWAALTLLPLLGIALLVARWLLPHTGSMKNAVLAYMGVITCMVALAGGSAQALGQPAILFGATGFFLSDLSVSRDRFIAPGFLNRAWGLPLYYCAQVLLAYSVP